MDEKSLTRIAAMERRLDECRAATEALTAALEHMESLHTPMRSLFQYYGSVDWFRDRDAVLPPEFPAGVLSEDAVYDLICETRDAARQMQRLADDILEKRIKP